MPPRNDHPTENYPAIPFDSSKHTAIGQADFQEPVFSQGKFIGDYIEVTVTLYPIRSHEPETGRELVAVRFGEMNVIRMVDPNLLYNIRMYHV